MRRRVLALTGEQREELEEARARDRRPYLRERAAALLRIAAGEAPHRVATTGLLRPRQPDTVYGWLGRYERAGLAGLAQRPRRHRGAFSPSGRGGGARAGARGARAARARAQPLAPA